MRASHGTGKLDGHNKYISDENTFVFALQTVNRLEEKET